jgi:hypothetical protein
MAFTTSATTTLPLDGVVQMTKREWRKASRNGWTIVRRDGSRAVLVFTEFGTSVEAAEVR